MNCGIFTEDKLGIYSQDWWAHTTEEKYLFHVLRHAHKVLDTVCYRTVEVKPGNIVLGRMARSKVLNHGAIVTAYPMAVHAIAPKVTIVNLSTDPLWSFKEVSVFDAFEESK